MNKLITSLPVKQLRRKTNLPVSLRTKKDELYYAKAKKAGKSLKPLLEEERLREWNFWALIKNEFPYSAAFKIHHLLIPKRVVSGKDLTEDELNELMKILDELSSEYDCHLVNYAKKQSIKHHFHVHMLIYKDNRKELKI